MNNLEQRRYNFACAASLMVQDEGLNISPNKILEIIGDYFDDEVSEIDYDPTDGSMDTCVRESVYNKVSEYFVGRRWPTYGDNINIDKFYCDLLESIEKEQNDS